MISGAREIFDNKPLNTRAFANLPPNSHAFSNTRSAHFLISYHFLSFPSLFLFLFLFLFFSSFLGQFYHWSHMSGKRDREIERRGSGTGRQSACAPVPSPRRLLTGRRHQPPHRPATRRRRPAYLARRRQASLPRRRLASGPSGT